MVNSVENRSFREQVERFEREKKKQDWERGRGSRVSTGITVQKTDDWRSWDKGNRG